jgi:fimbrial chaperone protein
MNPILRLLALLLALAGSALLVCGPARGRGIEVAPTIIQLEHGQMAVSLTVTNRDDQKIAFQIRSFAWDQRGLSEDVLTPTDQLLSSPPIATIAPGASQVVRIVLKKAPQSAENTYRIIFDQLPPPGQPGIVHMLVRLSIPLFAEPQETVAAHLRWKVVTRDGRSWLVASNDGSRHSTLRDIRVHTTDGRVLQVELKSPPHVLAGASRAWPIVSESALAPGKALRVTAGSDSGTIDEQVSQDSGP